MKNTYLNFLLLVLLLCSCEKNSDITDIVDENMTSNPVETVNFTWWALVQEEQSLSSWNDLDAIAIHNASIKLIYRDNILWESNTDASGTFRFDEQPVPSEGAYFLVETPGYHPLVLAVEGESIPLWRINMIRETYPDINGESITDAESYITLTGALQEPSTADGAWYYITNAQDELLGTGATGPELPRFYITTVPNEELFLHYNIVRRSNAQIGDCGDYGVVSLGSFSESQDIGALLDQNIDFSYDNDLIFIPMVTDCSEVNKIFNFDTFFKLDDLTFQSGAFRVPDCLLTSESVLVGVATQNPRKYTEFLVDYSPGQGTITTPDVHVCEDDDTFIQYTVGNDTQGGGEVFTFVDILADGQMILKQAEHSLSNEDRFTMIFDGFDIGNHQSTLDLVVRRTNDSGSWSYIKGIGGQELSATISMNNGEFIEGSFNGEVFDTEEVSLGIMEGTFRARIQ